ncbi:hypothetical protein ACFVIM_29165 [Streptomyces sp. NPDC057638]|uniref:hypothetical protein n=1 Tax=Streptomyces sp. NPDC057638 TaxID=3346190 RepID=UPI0036AA8FC3
MSPVRLAPGVALVDVPGRGLAVRTPDGDFLHVDTGGVAASALIARLRGGGVTDRGSAQASGADDPALDRLETAFDQAGFLHGSSGGGPLSGRQVWLLGDPVLTTPLLRCAEGAGARVREIGAGELAAAREQREPTAVVWCLDGRVPPGLWDEADLLPMAGVGWLRCQREGHQAWLEPLASAPGDVTSRDVRLRRLAATAAHRELAAYWDDMTPEPPGAGHSAASAALLAGLLTGELLAWARGEPARRPLRRIDLRDLAVSGHPVLPVPAVAPLPGARA